MSKFSVNTDELKRNADVLDSESGTLISYKHELADIGDDVLLGSSEGAMIRDTIRTIVGKVDKDAKNVFNLSRAANSIGITYDFTEARIIANQFGICLGGPFFPGGGGGGHAFDGAPVSLMTGAVLWDETVPWKVKSKAATKGKIIKPSDTRESLIDKHWVYDDDENKFVEEDQQEKSKKKVDWDVRLYGKEASTEYNSIHASGLIGDKDNSHLSGDIKVNSAAAKAGAYIGATGIGAYAGASYTALHMEGEGQLGNSNLGAYAKGEVDVGKVEAKAEAELGIKDGKLNAKLGGSAEAILGEASVKGGVKVAGTDVGVKASVNYGVGVKANIGIDGGKLKADLGATLGVGVGVTIEVDVSGTVDAVVSGAKSVLDEGGKIVSNVADGVGKAAESAGKALSDAGKAIGKFFGW